MKPCPACGYQVAALFYDGGPQPAVPAEDPRSPEEARAVPRPMLRFLRCLDCGHVFHGSFQSSVSRPVHRRWPKLLDEGRRLILERIPAKPCVAEIGSGDGAALEILAAAKPGGRYVAFDCDRSGDSLSGAVELRRESFLGQPHLAELKPDLILVRHVLEQERDPAGLLQSLSFAASVSGLYPLLYVEVSCADRALDSGRIEDFSHLRRSLFTTESFSRLLARCFPSLDAFGHGREGETAYACVRLKDRAEHIERARRSKGFAELASAARQVVLLELANLHLAGKRVAVWGSASDNAAFLNAYHMDAARFPLVVDCGAVEEDTYVPGTGQRIQPAKALTGQRLDAVLITSPGRAPEIVRQMAALGIRWERALLSTGGSLADYQCTGAAFESTAELLLAAG